MLRLPAVSLLAATLLSIGPRQPTPGEWIGFPTVSPDGKAVVFAYAPERGRPWQAHSIAIDGTHERTLTSETFYVEPVGFSPNGKRIVYRAMNRDSAGVLPRPNERTVRIMSINADGSDRRELYSITGGGANVAGWWPGGREVQVSMRGGASRNPIADSVWVIALDGSARRAISMQRLWLSGDSYATTEIAMSGARIMVSDREGATPRPLSAELPFQLPAAVSKDGKFIAFAGASQPPMGPGASRGAVYVIGADGKGIHKVLAEATKAFNFSFSADGSKLVYEDTRDGNTDIFVVDVDGTHERRLTTDPGDDALPSWTPDGRHVVFGGTRNGAKGIFIVDVDGKGERRIR